MLELKLFGNVEIHREEQPVTNFRTSKSQALLCYLAVTGQTHTRPALAGLLWGELPESNARMNLSKALTNLRRLVGDHLEITRQTISFNQDAPYRLDVETFDHHLSQGSNNPTIEQLREAVDLYRGEFLEGFYVRQAPAFEEWVLIQRARFRKLALQALHTLAAHYTAKGEAGGYTTGVDYVTRLLALEPWREEAHRQLMRLLALDGQRGAALAQFETCRQLLAEELGVEPGPKTRKLYERIRTGKLPPPASQPEALNETEPKPGDRASPPEAAEQAIAASLSLPTFFSSPPAQPVDTFPIVARERELAQLNRFLDQALDGQGRVAFITGTAGQGKTALAELFATTAQQNHPDLVVASGRCNAYGGLGDPYLPFREILEMLSGDIEAKWVAGDIEQEQAKRLWRTLPDALQALVKFSPDLVDIFVSGSALVERAAAAFGPHSELLKQLQTITSGKAAEQTPARLTQSALFMQYTHLLGQVARKRPLLLLLDDLQWADTGSISLLFHLGQRLAGQPILVVGIYRPDEVGLGSSTIDADEQDRHPLEPVINEFQRSFGNIHIDLGRAAGPEFVEALIDLEPNRLSESFRRALYRQTAGHALFTVEMLHGLQERGDLVKDKQGRWVEAPNLDWDILPARVEGVIKERIDRLPPALQETLRIASVVGETFTAEVVAQVQGSQPQQTVHQFGELGKFHRLLQSQGSRRLAASGQRFSFYRFRHILFQTYLYNGLDQNERNYLHEAVAQALESLYGKQAEQIAVRLARHYREAKRYHKAIHFLQRAGEQALRSYANHEAIIFFTDALTLLETAPETAARTRQELSLQLAIIPPLIATRGYAAPEVGKASVRAQALSQSEEASSERFNALRVLWAFHYVRAELSQAQESSQQLLTMAQALSDPTFLAHAHHSLGGTLFTLGKFLQSREHFEQALALYNPRRHQSSSLFFGPDTGVFCYAWNAHSLSQLGCLAQASASAQEALRLAKKLEHPFSLALALAYGAMTQQFCRDVTATKDWAERAITVCREHGFAYYLAWAKILRGWACARQGDAQAAIAQIQQGMKEIESTGARVREPYYQALLAEAYGLTGQVEKGLSILDEALVKANERKEHWTKAELHRLQEELFLKG